MPPSESHAKKSSKGSLSLGTLLVVVILLLFRCYAGNNQSQQTTNAPIPAQAVVAQEGTVEVFFTTPYLVYPDKPDARTPPPCEQRIIADLDAATHTIMVVAFEYTLKSVADALIRAKERGVEVLVALDRENLEQANDAEWAGWLEDANIPISWQETTGFLHSKFAIIDNAVVWTGSWNFTDNGTYRNNNNLLRITIPHVIDNYTTEFAQMFEESLFGNQKKAITPFPFITMDNITIATYFSPKEDVADAVIARLADATESIRFLAFSFTNDDIGNAMIERHNDGVTVEGVFETRNSRGTGSEFIRFTEEDMAVYPDGNCYTMHHKVIIIDNKTVITGSYNFTGRAEDTNDENLLIIDNATVAQLYTEEFARVYAQAQTPTTCGR